MPCVEGSIVINIGDMMQEMSDGAYVSTTHRVVKMDKMDGDDAGASDAGAPDAGAPAMAPADFLSCDRMSTPCFIHLKEKCPVSSTFGSAVSHARFKPAPLPWPSPEPERSPAPAC